MGYITIFPLSLDSKSQREKASALCCLTSSHVQKQYVHHMHAMNVLEHPCRSATASPRGLHTALRGIKQTVIDLWCDCLFCLAASDG